MRRMRWFWGSGSTLPAPPPPPPLLPPPPSPPAPGEPPRGEARRPGPSPTDVIIDTGTASLAGRRPENQDRCVADDRFALVSDGMGGHAGGAKAAELTTEAATGVLTAPGVEITEAFEQANERVRTARDEHPELAQMGATLTLASALDVQPERSRWVVAHVGDSPAYLVRADEAVRLTIDHTLAGLLLQDGAITEAEAEQHPNRHMLLRVIGGEPRVVPDLVEVELHLGEAIVIMSDGVSGDLGATEIHQLVTTAPTAHDAAARLVDEAIGHGSTDNVTAVVLRHVASSRHARPVHPVDADR